MAFCVKITNEKNNSMNVDNYQMIENLNSLKSQIDNIDNYMWKKLRWYINEYDFEVDNNVINRAYYKYLEIVKVFKLYERDETNVLHLAEAPGGFIQVSLEHRKQSKKIKKQDSEGFTYIDIMPGKSVNIWTMSLNANIKEHKEMRVPEYHKSILRSSVNILYGHDNKGDLLDEKNIGYLKNKTPEMDIITADGGFDEGIEYNNKETLHLNLIKNEIEIALEKLKEGGCFIIKVFDTFTKESKMLIEKLYKNFSEVWIYKPFTSRPTNSEKYIVCKGRTTIMKITDNISNNLECINYKLYEIQSSALKKALELCTVETLKYIEKHEKEILIQKNKKYEWWKKHITS